MKELLSTPEVAEELGLSQSRVRQLIVDKRLPVEKYGKINLVKRADLELVRNRVHGRPRKEKAA